MIIELLTFTRLKLGPSSRNSRHGLRVGYGCLRNRGLRRAAFVLIPQALRGSSESRGEAVWVAETTGLAQVGLV